MKSLAILGSTGSIGTQTLDIVRQYKDRLQVELLSASKISKKLLQQVKEFKPKYVYLAKGEKIEGVKTLIGNEGLEELANLDIDIFINGISGIAGIKPTYLLLKNRKNLATANKEAIICLGEILWKEYKNLFPIDSEHSAVLQCMLSGNITEIESIILTASGGPFFNFPVEKFKDITLEMALNHPNWKMGKKITIDSATLMNKGLEVIEAHYLFGLSYEKIDVLIHPDSLVHGIVQFHDGNLIASLSTPDMRIPISYAISYPERWYLPTKRLNLSEIVNLKFYKPDFNKFPLLKLAYEVGKAGSYYPIVLTVADEIAVNFFLDRKINFVDIPKVINSILDKAKFSSPSNIDDINYIISETIKIAKEILLKY